MRRLKVVFALALALAMMVTISVAPAMAKDNNNDNNDNNNNRHDNNFFDRHDDFGCFGCGFNRFNDRFDDDFECCDDSDLVFTGFSPFLAGVPDIDVDTENVANNSNLEGECFVTDIDGNGFIDQWEIDITCFV
jgi:hypothetical protein